MIPYFQIKAKRVIYIHFDHFFHSVCPCEREHQRGEAPLGKGGRSTPLTPLLTPMVTGPMVLPSAFLTTLTQFKPP